MSRQKYYGRKKTHRLVIIFSMVVLLIGLVSSYYGTRPIIIQGLSMFPSISHKDRFISIENFNINRFDIVSVVVNNENLCKRVIGLPKDVIQFTKNNIIINNELMTEYYVLDISDYEIGKSYTLKDDEYFVMGDNRNNSHDSRAFGPIKKIQIKSKILHRVWRQ